MMKLFFIQYRIAILFLMLASAMACSKKDQVANPAPPPPAADNRYPANLIIDSVTMASIRMGMGSDAALATAYQTIVAQPAATALNKMPQPVLSATSDNAASIGSQANDCKLLATHWLYLYATDPVAAKPYFSKIISTLLAWVGMGNAASTHLPNETVYLGFYEAYSVVRSRMSAADKFKVDNWLMTRALVYQNFPPRVNNWETIRINYLFYLGYILQSKELMAHAESAYTTLLNVNLMAGGKSEDLMSRDAFAYHAYNLAFYARIFRAKLNFEGKQVMESFRNRKNNIGVSVPDMITYWKPFLLDPTANVHIEFVNTNYEPDKQRSDYNKPYQPSSSVYALEELLVANSEVKQIIEQVTGGNRYNRKLSGFLYWP